jgi:predicted nuclease of predicted toxin-antitoxin system
VTFLSNENFPRLSVEFLRSGGHTVYSIQEDCPGISDEEVMRIAKEKNAIILTFDRDYGELIFARKLPSPPGVMYFRFIPTNPLEPAKVLNEYLQVDDIEWIRHFSIIGRARLRQRKLEY